MIDTADKKWIEDQIRRTSGSASAFALASAKLFVGTQKDYYPHSYPLVPAQFVGDYTDTFDTTSHLTGPFVDGVSGAAISAALGELTFTGTDSGAGRAWCGTPGSYFLPGGETWAVEIKVTECDTLYEGAGLQIFGAIGRKCRLYFYFQTSSPLLRAYAEDANVTTADLASLPTTAVPLYLRVEHSYSDPTHTLVYKYKYEGDGGWTTIATHTPSESTMTWAGYNLDVGPLLAAAGGITTTVRFDSISVEYLAGVNPGSLGHYAFIPVSDFPGYRKDDIYITQSDGQYLGIVPEEGMFIYEPTFNTCYRWDGSTWVHHQYDHNYDLTGIGANDHHDQLHDLDSTADHTGVTMDEDDIMVGDANGLPKSGAMTIAEIQAEIDSDITTHAALDTGVHGAGGDVLATDADIDILEQQATAWLAGLNLASIPGPYIPRVFTQATQPTAAQMVDGEQARWIDSDDSTEYLVWRNGANTFAVEGT